MQIKKYTAPTLKEATARMKQELGSEAIILSTRIIEADQKQNRKKMFELTVGIEKVITPQKKSTASTAKVNDAKKSLYDELKSISEKVYPKTEIPTKKVPVERPVAQKTKSNPAQETALGKELKEIV